jgi:outer membrane lipoprotein SlyB
VTPYKSVIGGALALSFAASLAVAQTPAAPPTRIRGTIEKLDGQTLTVKSREGADVSVKLADNTPVRTVLKQTLADVKQGGFVGITAMPQPDGTQKAIEIHIFPESMRGTGEGHRPWDLVPNSTMTNATVDSEVAVSDGKKLVLKYKDGEKAIIVTFAPATMADVKPGEKVVINANKQADGSITAANLTVGKNGVNPPM